MTQEQVKDLIDSKLLDALFDHPQILEMIDVINNLGKEIKELKKRCQQLEKRKQTERRGIMASMKTNMAGLMRWHRNNPRKRLDGYFTVDGKSLTHNQVLAALEYAIEHNCKTEQDIPSDIVEKIVNGEIVPKKGGKQ